MPNSTAPDPFSWTVEDDNEAPPVLRQRGVRENAEMDVTPMIDVTFLLLIFFIVCSTTDQQATVELAKATHGKGISERDAVVFIVQEGGIDSAPVLLETTGEQLASDADEQQRQVEEAVLNGLQNEQKTKVLIKADRNVACRDVQRVIQGASRAKGMHIHLAVLEND